MRLSNHYRELQRRYLAALTQHYPTRDTDNDDVGPFYL